MTFRGHSKLIFRLSQLSRFFIGIWDMKFTWNVEGRILEAYFKRGVLVFSFITYAQVIIPNFL